MYLLLYSKRDTFLLLKYTSIFLYVCQSITAIILSCAFVLWDWNVKAISIIVTRKNLLCVLPGKRLHVYKHLAQS